MRILIIGREQREQIFRELCQERGHALPEHGPWDRVVLPLPKSSLPEEWEEHLPPGQKIICGLTAPAFDALAKKRRWQLLRPLRDENYMQKNALLSAEGAVFYAMEKMDIALPDAKCMVIGYGRLGRALTNLLRSMGCRVTVAARRRESREEAGESSIPMEEIGTYLPRIQAVFNTVPSPVINRDMLAKANKDAWFYELASAPYGMDPEDARKLGVRYVLESGIPGRYCPRSAAKALLDYMESEEKKNE